MKNILIIIALFVTIQVQAQLAKETGSYTYHQVVRVSGSKHDLFTKATDWAKEDHSDTRNAIQYASEEKGQIVIQGGFDHLDKKGVNKVAYICMIEFRNGMYKESYREFKNVFLNGKEVSFEDKKLKSKTKLLKETDLKIMELSASFKEHMTSKITASEKR